MELGVDIGGLSAVAMNNAPPGPSNFLQRPAELDDAGRLLQCPHNVPATPHAHEHVFSNPLWPFCTAVHLPQVSLQNIRIVERHVHALVLADFLRSSGAEATRLSAGWFLEAGSEDESAPADRLIANLSDASTHCSEWLRKGIEHLIQRTALSGSRFESLLASSAEALRDIAARWLAEVSALESELYEARWVSKERQRLAQPDRHPPPTRAPARRVPSQGN